MHPPSHPGLGGDPSVWPLLWENFGADQFKSIHTWSRKSGGDVEIPLARVMPSAIKGLVEMCLDLGEDSRNTQRLQRRGKSREKLSSLCTSA